MSFGDLPRHWTGGCSTTCWWWKCFHEEHHCPWYPGRLRARFLVIPLDLPKKNLLDFLCSNPPYILSFISQEYALQETRGNLTMLHQCDYIRSWGRTKLLCVPDQVQISRCLYFLSAKIAEACRNERLYRTKSYGGDLGAGIKLEMSRGCHVGCHGRWWWRETRSVGTCGFMLHFRESRRTRGVYKWNPFYSWEGLHLDWCQQKHLA